MFSIPDQAKAMDDRDEEKTKPIIAGVDLNNPSEAFKLVMIICVILFVFAVLFFSLLRLKFRQIYSPRLLLIENKIYTLGTMPRSLFSWILPGIKATDDDIFTFAGIDALVYIRFLKLVLRLALLTLPYGIIVLLPININGGNKLTDSLDKLSMSNVKNSSSLLWAHFVAVWLYSLAVIVLTYYEWNVYIKYRQRYLKKGTANQFVVILQNIPTDVLEDHSLKVAVEKLFPKKVFDVYVVKRLDKWEELVERHDAYVLKWERAKFRQDQTDELVKVRKIPCGAEYDAVLEYEKELEMIQEKLFMEKGYKQESLPTAFVFFKSLKTRSLALQNKWHVNPLLYQTIPAPAPSDIIWKNLRIPAYQRVTREVIGIILVFFLVLFWTIPITFVSSLTKFHTVAQEFKWLDEIKYPQQSFQRCLTMTDGNTQHRNKSRTEKLCVRSGYSKLILSFVQGVVPVVLIIIFYLILPYILRAIARFQGKISQSDVAMMVFKCLFIFQSFNTFFIYIISGSVFQSLSQILKKPFELPNLLAKTLPSQAGFFLNYLALVSFVGLAIELTRIGPFIWISIQLKWITKTSRDRIEAWRPRHPEYEIMYSKALLFFLIGISYSILSPIIIPFFVLYNAFGCIVWTYQLLHVYIPKFEHGGKFWPEVFHRILSCVIIFQLLMIGVFFLKRSWYAGTLISPAVFMIVIYWWIMNRRYNAYGDSLVLSEAMDSKHADPRFLENVRNSYIQDHQVPDVFKISTDDKYCEFESYAPIHGTNDSEEEMSEATEIGLLIPR